LSDHGEPSAAGEYDVACGEPGHHGSECSFDAINCYGLVDKDATLGDSR
jgi:hypothetical protein